MNEQFYDPNADEKYEHAELLVQEALGAFRERLQEVLDEIYGDTAPLVRGEELSMYNGTGYRFDMGVDLPAIQVTTMLLHGAGR